MRLNYFSGDTSIWISLWRTYYAYILNLWEDFLYTFLNHKKYLKKLESSKNQRSLIDSVFMVWPLSAKW